MVKLPDASALGTRLPRAVGGGVSYPTSFPVSPVGGALESLGKAGMRVAGDMMAEGAAERKRAEAEARAEAERTEKFGVQRRFLEMESQWGQTFTERAQGAAPGAAGFSEALRSDYQQSAREFFKTVPDYLKPDYDVQLFELESRLGKSADEFARAERKRYGLAELEEGQNLLLSRTAADPDSWVEVRRQGEELARNTPGLTPVEIDEQTRAWRKRQAAALWEVDHSTDPAGARQRLGERVPPEPPASSSQAGGAMAARSVGGNPAYRDAIARIESDGSGGYAAVGPTHPKMGRALGRYQVMEANIGPWSKAALGREVTAEEFLATPEIQDAVFDHRFGGYVQKYGNPQDAASAWFTGRPLAQGANAKDVLGTSGSEYVNKFNNALAGAGILSDPDPRYADLPFEDRLRLYSDGLRREEEDYGNYRDARELSILRNEVTEEAELINDPRLRDGDVSTLLRTLRTQTEGRRSLAAAQMANELDDYIAYTRSGKVDDTSRYALPDLQAVLGPEKGAAAYQEIERARAYGTDAAAIQWATPEEMAGIVKERQSMLAAPEGFRQNLQDINGLVTQIQARDKGISEDPAAYVQEAPEVQTALQAMGEAMAAADADPADQAAAAARYAEVALARQEKLGVPPSMRRVLSKKQVAGLAMQFKSQEAGGENAADLMRGMEAQWGKRWPKVFAELSTELPGPALVVGAMNRMDQARAAEQLAEASLVGREELAKAFPTKDVSDLKDTVRTALRDFGATLANNGPAAEATYGTFEEAINLLALTYMREGEAPSRAAERAYDDVLGKKYEFRDTFRVPREYDADMVAEGAARALEALPSDIALPTSLFGLPEDQTREAYLSAVKSAGFWVTAPDESGLVLYDETRTAVMRTNGQPVMLTWADLQSAPPAVPVSRVDPAAPAATNPAPVFMPDIQQLVPEIEARPAIPPPPAMAAPPVAGAPQQFDAMGNPTGF